MLAYGPPLCVFGCSSLIAPQGKVDHSVICLTEAQHFCAFRKCCVPVPEAPAGALYLCSWDREGRHSTILTSDTALPLELPLGVVRKRQHLPCLCGDDKEAFKEEWSELDGLKCAPHLDHCQSRHAGARHQIFLWTAPAAENHGTRQVAGPCADSDTVKRDRFKSVRRISERCRLGRCQCQHYAHFCLFFGHPYAKDRPVNDRVEVKLCICPVTSQLGKLGPPSAPGTCRTL